MYKCLMDPRSSLPHATRFQGHFHDIFMSGHYYFFICLTVLHGNCWMLPSNVGSYCLRDSGWAEYDKKISQSMDLTFINGRKGRVENV